MSQFIEIFYGMETTPVKDYIDDSFPGEWGTEDKDGNGVKVIRTTNFTNSGKLNLADVVTRSIEDRKVVRKQIKKYDTILERSGGTADNPVGRVVLFEEDNLFLCNNFTQVLRFKDVDPRFAFYALYYFYQTNRTAIRSMGSKTTGIQNLNMSKYLEIGIPNASDEDQKAFVTIAEQADKKLLVATDEMVKSQFIEMFGNPLSLNQKNELKRLGECCILNPRRPNIALCDTDKVSFIPMPAVSEDGYLVDMTDEEYGKVKKGFTYFENNDVLFAKITPCMENGKGAIVHGLTNGIGMGSTEFHVLRPINGISSPYWLLALTRMPIFRERAAKNMSGTGGQKRVSASYLDHFMVGLPAMEEQRRFEAIYRQADKSKFELKQCIENIDKVIKSFSIFE
jgi:restriction endonuclease S subunit